MKHVLLSADNNPSVYLVPDIVAGNLESYCLNFCDKWLQQSPHAAKYRTNEGVCYNETDFVEYLNTWLFPDEKSVLIETLGRMRTVKDLPQKYKEYKWFNF